MNRKQRREQQKQKPKQETKVKTVISKADEQRIIDKALKQYEENYIEATIMGVKYTTNAMFAALAIALHDKWGWGHVRTKRLFAQISDTFDSVQGDYVKIEELIDVVRDEMGIDLR